VTKRVSILLVANSAWNLFHYRRPWIQAMLREGIVVLTAAPADEYIERLERLTGQKHHTLKNLAARGMNLFTDLACIWELICLYQGLRPNMVVHFTIKPNIYGGLAARIAAVPYLGVITGFGYAFLRGGFQRKIAILLHRIGLARAKRVVFYNATDQAEFEQMGISKSYQKAMISGSGVDVIDFPKQPLPSTEGKSIRFLYLGRMLRDKGIVELLEATKLLLAKKVRIELRLVGSTDVLNPAALSREDLQTYAGAELKDNSQSGMEQARIQYFSSTQDVHSHLQWCHVFVLPSYREGLSRAGVEALSSGRPVLLTDVPGCRELYSNSPVNGVLVPPQNAEALAEGMVSFINKESQSWQAMADRSRQLAEEQFAAAHSATAFIELLKITVS